jgi:hypothetical protein
MKNKHFHSKLRGKDKKKTFKSDDPNDILSNNLYQSIDVGPSVLPKTKYCDITGFQCNYIDPISRIKYFNNDIYKIIQNLNEPTINQYLSIRKALYILK